MCLFFKLSVLLLYFKLIWALTATAPPSASGRSLPTKTAAVFVFASQGFITSYKKSQQASPSGTIIKAANKLLF